MIPRFPQLIHGRSLLLEILLCVCFCLSLCRAHNRLECPPPRSGETGQKNPPCDAPDNPALPAFPLIPNALNTITWLESIAHPGAPGRLALSLEGQDAGFEDCLLLDHIPHDEESRPIILDETTYHRSSITVYIPDVYCERCHLQLVTFMTDEAHGLPAGGTCAYPPAKSEGYANASFPNCFVFYHSCAPVSINGTVPRDDIAQCNTSDFYEKLDWPFTDMPYSTYFNKGDPGLYNQTTSQLLAGGAPIQGCNDFSYCNPDVHFVTTETVPPDAAYVQLEGFCADVVNIKVAPFRLGQLPAEPKDPNEPDASIDCAPCFQSILNVGFMILALIGFQ